MVQPRKLVQCPRCRFRNPGTAQVCLACKGALPQDAPAPGGGSPFVGAAPPAAGETTFSSGDTAFGSGLSWPAHGGPAPAPGPERHDGTRRLARPVPARGPEVDPQPSPPAGVNASQLFAQLQAMARGGAGSPPAQSAPAPASGPRPPAPGPRPPAPARPPAGPSAPPTPATVRLDAAKLTRGTPPVVEAVQPPVSQVPRFDVDDPRIVAWLHCEPFAPVPVGIEPVLTLGRGSTCGLVLPHPGVSRTAAIVRVAGRELVFEDRSTYGSYVNGQRVLTRPLQVGDALLIGPYEIKVRSTDEVRGKTISEAEETRPLQSFSSLPSADAMSGRLEKSSLAEVLQAIEFNQKTGTLEVFADGDRSGQLVVYEGSPMFATFGDLEDEAAVCAMIAQRRGYYTFRSKIEAGERTLKTTITGLLLEANRRLDEQGAPT